jgi:UDP-2,3-diacylglucosamine pyrophosphatase LpxH
MLVIKEVMMTPYCDTIILSDLHLGSEVSRARDALRLLKHSSFERLILLGDIFCDLNFGRLKRDHWRLLSYIRKLSNPKRGIEVVWVEGNHDHGLSLVMSHLVGIKVYQQYVWEYGGKRHLAIHGHQFDRFLTDNAFLGSLASAAFLVIQKLDFRQQRLVQLIDRLDTRWRRHSPKVAAGALAHARVHNAQRVFCGHTHLAMQWAEDGIEYFNTGCWIQATATYITVDEQGVQIHEYDQRSDDYYPGEERGDPAAEVADFSDAAGLLGDAEYEGVCS